jgi:hypothetical protein
MPRAFRLVAFEQKNLGATAPILVSCSALQCGHLKRTELELMRASVA